MRRKIRTAAVGTATVLLSGLVVFGTLHQPFRRAHRASQWDRYLWKDISGGDAIEVGAQTVEDNSWGAHFSYYNYLVWHHHGKKRPFFIDDLIPMGGSQLHQQGEQLWIIDKSGQVLCTLDRSSGQFINHYGAVVDWRLSEAEQENLQRPSEDNTGYLERTPFPGWAVASKESLIAKQPE